MGTDKNSAYAKFSIETDKMHWQKITQRDRQKKLEFGHGSALLRSLPCKASPYCIAMDDAADDRA
jgi:hypothetical protein